MCQLQGKRGTLQRQSLSAKSHLQARNWNTEVRGRVIETCQSKIDINLNVTAENFQGVRLEDLHILQRLVDVNFLVYDFEVLDKNKIGELVERSLQNSVPQLTY